MNKIRLIDFFWFFNMISIVFLIVLIPEKLEYFSSEKTLTYCLVILINIIFFFNVSKKYFSTWIRYDVLFIVGFLIVHFQIPLMESLGIELADSDYIWINKKVVNYATWISAISLLLWMLGFVFFIKKNNNTSALININQKVNVVILDYILIGLFLLFLSLVGNDFLSGAYNGTVNWGAGSAYVFIILQAILYLRIIYFFINNKHVKNITDLLKKLLTNKIFTFILLSYFLIFLAIGDRGPLMQIVIIIVSAYSVFINKTSLKTLFLLIFLGSFIFALIGMGRTRDSSTIQGKNIFERGIENFQTNEESFNPTQELANSVRILYRAIDLVPNNHPYLFGSTLVFDLVAVFPFAASSFVELADIPLIYQSSSNFFTIIGQGDFFTYGEGSEIIADLYINFGIYGVMIVMFLFGYFISNLSFQALIIKNDKAIIVYFILSATAIYINRANLLMPLRDVIYPLIISSFLIKNKSI